MRPPVRYILCCGSKAHGFKYRVTGIAHKIVQERLGGLHIPCGFQNGGGVDDLSHISAVAVSTTVSPAEKASV